MKPRHRKLRKLLRQLEILLSQTDIKGPAEWQRQQRSKSQFGMGMSHTPQRRQTSHKVTKMMRRQNASATLKWKMRSPGLMAQQIQLSKYVELCIIMLISWEDQESEDLCGAKFPPPPQKKRGRHLALAPKTEINNKSKFVWQKLFNSSIFMTPARLWQQEGAPPVVSSATQPGIWGIRTCCGCSCQADGMQYRRLGQGPLIWNPL